MTTLAITPGDPGGIGPDLCLQAAIDGELDGIVIADPEIIERRADLLGLPVSIMHADDFNPDRIKGVSMLIQWRLPTQTIPQEFQIRSMLNIVYNHSSMLCTGSKLGDSTRL